MNFRNSNCAIIHMDYINVFKENEHKVAMTSDILGINKT